MPHLQKYAAVAYANPETVQNTFDLSLRASFLEGDLVECGVAAGAQIGVMLAALNEIGRSRRIWGFDSFEGIPLAGPRDTVQPGFPGPKEDFQKPLEGRGHGDIQSSGITVHSIESVIQNLNGWGHSPDRYRLVRGWFQDTIPKVESEIHKVSLLRLDGDLYESTKVCLEYLHPKVVPGGFVIIDDYALDGCRIAVTEYLEKIGLKVDLIPVNEREPTVHWYQIPR